MKIYAQEVAADRIGQPLERPASPADALAELIAATARGDEHAFRRLYRATADTLYGVALRVCRRGDWAEEVLQESYVSVWRHAARFDRSKGAAMTWLIRIVRNQAIDTIRPTHADGFERKHGVELPDDDALDALFDAAAAESGEMLDYSRRAERLSACLAALDARQRQSLALVFFHGLSHGDLARHLRHPLGTVKAWVRRGMAKLAACLAARGA